jgi:hypothetical protein
LIDDVDAAAARTTLGLGDIAITDLIDEDDMASDSANRAPSQQSVKAFVLNNVGSSNVLAMCAFDGTGSGTLSVESNAINVTSVTKNGTGDYTINFTTNLPHANYHMTGSSVDPGSDINTVIHYHSSSARAVGSVRIVNINRAGGETDSALITVSIIG